MNPAETLRAFERVVESMTGQKASDIRNLTLTQMRRNFEVKSKPKRRLRIESRFPLIGRGNVMRDKVVDHDTVEILLNQSLR
jgi:hypothetical protein